MLKKERRNGRYIERLTSHLVLLCGLGVFWVLLDPVIIIPLWWEGSVLKLGGTGFSTDLKANVVGTAIVGVIVAVVGSWFRTDNDAGPPGIGTMSPPDPKTPPQGDPDADAKSS